MKSVRRMARRLPLPLQRAIRVAINPGLAVERNGLIRRLASEPHRLPSEAELQRLKVAWNGGGGVADIGYLQEVALRAQCAEGPILECGSGLTTLLLGIYAKTPVLSLEENRAWHRRMRAAMRWYGLGGVTIAFTPVVHSGGFAWFDVSSVELATSYELVVCDGPVSRPHYSVPSRYGLLPVVGDRLRGATILLDDVEREEEQEVLRRWSRQGAKFAISERRGRDFAIVLVPPSQC